jgi:hypothetical protein
VTGSGANPVTPWSVSDSENPLKSSLAANITEQGLRELWTDEVGQVVQTAACSRSPWYWFRNYCVTSDSHWASKGWTGPHQRFPAKRHLRSFVYILWRYPFSGWPKARQVMMSWTVDGYILGESQFVPGRLWMIQSKKEMDAQDQLRRIRGMFMRQKEMAPWLGPELVGDNVGRLDFSNGSSIVAVAQGAHHVQSYTPAGLFMDEVQLQDEAEEAYFQALPACERIIMVGSADVSWFYDKFLTDEIGETRDGAA